MAEKVDVSLNILNKKLNQPLVAALEVCARCGICTEACHYFIADPEPDHAPAVRAEKLRRIYRAEHDLLSRLIPSWTGAERLTEERLVELAEMAFTKCTMCRRCTYNCPMGVDTPLLMSTIRAMATASGEGPEILEMLADAAIEKGRNPEIYLDFYLDSIKDMEKDLQDLTGNQAARIPVQKQGVKLLYVALAGAHTILPAAAIFETVGEDWTLSIFESANYGVFLADVDRAKAIAKRIVDEANKLDVKEIVISECGHAYTSMRWTAPNWFGQDFNFRVRSIVEVIAEYIQQDRLSLDPNANPEAITYHDACNMARNGGVIEEPRTILNAATTNFRELIPNREEAYCCGGGGGLVAEPDYTEVRLAAGKPKVNQIERSGAQLVVAACENCRLQLGELNQHYDAGFGVTSLADLVVKAMRLPGYRGSVEAEIVESSVEDEARIQEN
jgi:Fe-S oxidoreductase